ncbi:MAG: MFS transporter [Candidatus Hadarchaeum sp.]|uniref:MFS transporter n=1 Tax=Candidatus Hadarchaeum sp. TaxID=2883567 RepID=UPI00316B884C
MSWLMIAVFLMSMAMGGSAIALPLYASSLGASYTEIGMLGVAYVILGAIFSLPIGQASDKHEKKKFIIGGFLSTAIVMTLYAFAPSIPWLLVLRFLQGLTETVLWINVQVAIIASSRIDARGRAMGSYGRWWGFGVALGPIIGGFCYSVAGAQITFMLWGLVALASAAVATKIPEIGPQSILDKPNLSKILALCFAGLIYVGTVAIINTILPVYATSGLKMSAFDVGLLITFFVLIRAVIFTPMGALSDKVGHRPVILAGLLGVSLTFFLLYLASDAILLTVLLIPLAIAEGLLYPSVLSAFSKSGGGAGYLMGIFNLVTSIGWGVFPGVGGAIADSFGPTSAFLISGLIGLVSAAILWKKLPKEG